MRVHWGCLAGGLLAVFTGSASAAPVWSPGEHMTEAVSNVMDGVLRISGKTPYGYDRGVCFLAAYVQPGRAVTFKRPFESGESYLVVAGGDRDTLDLDIEMVDEEASQVVAADKDQSATALVLYTPARSKNLVIRVKLENSKVANGRKVGCFCCLAILRRGGFDVPSRNLVSAAGNLLGECNRLNNRTSKMLKFHDDENQWAIYGAVFEGGEERTITNIGLGTGERVVMAAGDDNAADIDMYLLDSRGDVALKDEDPDSRPFIGFRATNAKSVGLRIKNAKSNGRTLILATVLQAK